MISKNQKHSLLRSLLSNSLPVLCKNGLGIPDVQFSVEALVGITVGDDGEVILVSIKETITSDGSNISHVWSNEKDDANLKIKKENEGNIIPQGTEVCDLTEEPDEIDCSIENLQPNVTRSKGFGHRRSNISDESSFGFASHNAAITDGQGSSDQYFDANFVKEEYQDDNINEMMYGNTETEFGGKAVSKVELNDDDEEEDSSYSPSYSAPRSRRPRQNRRGSLGLQSARAGRSRFIHRGRLKRLGSTNSSTHFSTTPNFASGGEHSHSDDMVTRNVVRSQDGTYQDIMKEMCQQVMSQSMSVETQYVCHVCQARRCSKSSLMDHIRGTHLAMDKYTCRECGERFRWFMQLHRHRKKFHPNPGDEQMMGDGDYGAEDDGGSFQGFEENQ